MIEINAMLSIEEARKTFGIKTDLISDEELEKVINDLTVIADSYIQEHNNALPTVKDSGARSRSLR